MKPWNTVTTSTTSTTGTGTQSTPATSTSTTTAPEGPPGEVRARFTRCETSRSRCFTLPTAADIESLPHLPAKGQFGVVSAGGAGGHVMDGGGVQGGVRGGPSSGDECRRRLSGIPHDLAGQVTLIGVSVPGCDLGHGSRPRSAQAFTNRTTPTAAFGVIPICSENRVVTWRWLQPLRSTRSLTRVLPPLASTWPHIQSTTSSGSRPSGGHARGGVPATSTNRSRHDAADPEPVGETVTQPRCDLIVH